MTLTIHDDSISSDRTPHTARLIPGSEYEYAWEVSWLPSHRMDRLTAVTAMMFADTMGSGAIDHDRKLQHYASVWAADLGLTTQDAIAMASQPPGTISTERGSAEPDEPEPGGS